MDFHAKSKMKGDADAFLVKEREEDEKGKFDLGKEGESRFGYMYVSKREGNRGTRIELGEGENTLRT